MMITLLVSSIAAFLCLGQSVLNEKAVVLRTHQNQTVRDGADSLSGEL